MVESQLLNFDPLQLLVVLLSLFAILLVVLGQFGRWLIRHHATLWRWADRAWHCIRSTAVVQGLARRVPWLWRFINRRLSTESYLGLHFTVGILLSLAALMLFGQIAEAVVGNEDLTNLDLSLANTLHQSITPAGGKFFTFITWLGSFPVMLALGIIIGFLLVEHGYRRLLIGWVVGLTGGSLLNLALKAVFQRPRPEFDVPFAGAIGWSFPSGHAMGSLIGYGLLAYILMRFVRGYWQRIIVLICASMMVLLIGFSRLYLGVHYFSDVIGGYMAGTVWLLACVSGMEVIQQRSRQRKQR